MEWEILFGKNRVMKKVPHGSSASSLHAISCYHFSFPRQLKREITQYTVTGGKMQLFQIDQEEEKTRCMNRAFLVHEFVEFSLE